MRNLEHSHVPYWGWAKLPGEVWRKVCASSTAAGCQLKLAALSLPVGALRRTLASDKRPWRDTAGFRGERTRENQLRLARLLAERGPLACRDIAAALGLEVRQVGTATRWCGWFEVVAGKWRLSEDGLEMLAREGKDE